MKATNTITLPPDAALILIDLQNAIDHPGWGSRNNPDAEKKVAFLLEFWRATRRPVYHIRHDSSEPASHYRPGQPGNEFKSEALPIAGEIVIPKRTNSAFIGTDLEAKLRGANQNLLVVAGVITNNSVEATVRMAGTSVSIPSSSRTRRLLSAAAIGTACGEARMKSTR